MNNTLITLKRIAMKHLFITWFALFAFLHSAHAQADRNLFNHLSVGLTVGTPGIGLDVAVPAGDYVQLRAGFSIMPKFSVDADFDINENLLPEAVAEYLAEARDKYQIPYTVTATGKPSLTTGKILADIYPIKSSSFHLTAGMYFGSRAVAGLNNKTSLISIYNANQDIEAYNEEVRNGNIPGGTVQNLIGINLNDRILTADSEGNVQCDVKAWQVRPYLGLGFGRAVPRKTVGCMFEIGCQFWGSPKIYNNGDLLTEETVGGGEGGNFIKTVSKITVYPVLNFRICAKIL